MNLLDVNYTVQSLRLFDAELEEMEYAADVMVEYRDMILDMQKYIYRMDDVGLVEYCKKACREVKVA